LDPFSQLTDHIHLLTWEKQRACQLTPRSVYIHLKDHSKAIHVAALPKKAPQKNKIKNRNWKYLHSLRSTDIFQAQPV
jgi:hypothetical protein